MAYGRDKRSGGVGGDRAGEPAQHTGLVPGKRTLVEMAFPPAPRSVSRRADSGPAGAEPAPSRLDDSSTRQGSPLLDRSGGVRADGEELRVATVARDVKQIM